MNRHFELRVRERLPGACPVDLFTAVQWAIRCERTDLVRFVTRVCGNDRRLFGACTADGRPFGVIVDTADIVPITVVLPGFAIKRPGKPPMVFGEAP